MTEQEEVMKSKKSLLMKYELPVDRLSFEYVEKCNDRKEMEKIVKVLRSGEEGYFEKLIHCAETRLRQIAPESRVLRTEELILTKSMLEPEHWNKVANDIKDWTSEMKSREQELKEASNVRQPSTDLPAVRNVKSDKTQSSHKDEQEAGPSRVKSVVPRDYADWDKFDVDKELLKMELEDERKKEQAMKKKRQQEKEKKKSKRDQEDKLASSADNLSAAEKEIMATQEKDRGNEYYRACDYELAVKHYTSSILLCPTPNAYNNRAIAFIKLHKFGAALADCNEVLEAEPFNVKALLRRGIAHQNKNNHEQAFEDFSKVGELEPDNRLAKSLAEQMKTKCGANLKSVRMTIEDEPTNFVFPAPRQNVAVNEWGLAKTMCRCSGIPSWSRRTPPKCRTCLRTRTERRAKQEEERLRMKEVAEEASDMGEGSSGVVVKVTPADDDSEGRSNENTDNEGNNYHMQIDEKGSGDMWATEKIAEIAEKVIEETDCLKDAALPSHTDLVSGEPKSKRENEDMKEIEKGAVENVLETNKFKYTNDELFMGFNTNNDDDNIEKKGKGNLEADKKEVKKMVSEAKQEVPSCSNNNTDKEGSSDTKRTRKSVGKTSPEANKLKNAKVSVGNTNNNNDETNQTKGNGDKRTPGKTPSGGNKTKYMKQKASPGTDSKGPKETKVKVANKYKKNVKTPREEATEQCTATQESPEETQSVSTITSPYEFVKVWQALKVDTDLSAHAQVLRAVPPSDLPSVLGNKLDGPMLSTILLCLEKYFAPELILEYMNNLILLPRFNIVNLFLQPSEKQAVHQLLEKLDSLGHRPSVAVWNAFHC